jgi:hypothetical protein
MFKQERAKTGVGGASRGIMSIVAAALLLASGAGYRLLAGRIEAQTSSLLPLNKPLEAIPLTLGPWSGEDIPLDERVLLEVAMDDKYFNRVYANTSNGQVATVYVGYIGRAHRWLVHRPDICYPAHGLQRSSEKEVALTGPNKVPIPCLLQEFDSAEPMKPSVMVLSTYIVNGRYTNDKHVRNATLFTDRPPFIARIQLGVGLSRDRESSISALRDLLPRLTEPLGTIIPYLDD